jgi:hypothetical protein
MGSKSYLYGWVFTYNSMEDRWKATNRDNYFKLWNEGHHESILESRNIDSLKEMIIKGKGDLKTILKIKNELF